MSKMIRVVFEYEDKIMQCVGDEAEKLDKHIFSLCAAAQNRVGNQNPFAHDPINWQTVEGGTIEQRRDILENGPGPGAMSVTWTSPEAK